MTTSTDTEGTHEFELLGDEACVGGQGDALGRKQRKKTLHGDRLRLGVFQNTLGAMTATEARVAHSSHRSLDASGRRGGAIVHVDGAALHLTRDRFASSEIATPDARAQTIRRVVG